jgi:protein gp37
MAETSGISWTHATFNPWRGCTKVAPECAHCYADGVSKRNPSVLGIWGDNGKRVVAAPSYWKEPIKWNAAAAKGVCHDCAGKGKIKVEQQLIVAGVVDKVETTTTFAPCRTCKSTGKIGPHRRRVFCASMADVFEDWRGPMYDTKEQKLYTCPQCGHIDHDNQDGTGHWEKGTSSKWGEAFERGEHEKSPYSYWLLDCNGGQCDYRGEMLQTTMADVRVKLFKTIDATPHLDWLLLTKRPENIRKMWPCPLDTDGDGNCHICSKGRPHYRNNVWLGTSAGTQQSADKFVPALLKCRDLSPVLFVSAEPMLDAVDFTLRGNRIEGWDEDWKYDTLAGKEYALPRDDSEPKSPRIDWLILGVESSGSRLGRLGVFANEREWQDHAFVLVETAKASGVKPFVKQIPLDGKLEHDVSKFPASLRYQEFPR